MYDIWYNIALHCKVKGLLKIGLYVCWDLYKVIYTRDFWTEYIKRYPVGLEQGVSNIEELWLEVLYRDKCQKQVNDWFKRSKKLRIELQDSPVVYKVFTNACGGELANLWLLPSAAHFAP